MALNKYQDTLATTPSESILYDGQGTANALQTAATETALAALSTDPDDIALRDSTNGISVWLMNETGSATCTLVVGQFDSSGNLLAVYEEDIGATDQTFDTDRDTWGLTTGTDKPAKDIVAIAFRRHEAAATLQIWLSVSSGGVWYARYQLSGD